MTIQPIERPQGTLEAQMQYAEILAASNLLPAAFRKQPANVLLAAQLGEALGIPTIQAINSIHVIEGKPSAGADLIASIVRRAGHKLRIVERPSADGPVVTAKLIRADDPDFEFVAVWDTAKARQAGLLGKENWKKYPGQMMRNRAVMEVCRQGASDAMFGVNYDPEELEGGHAPAWSPDARDWWVEFEAASSVEQLRQLHGEAHRAGQLDERLRGHAQACKQQLLDAAAADRSRSIVAAVEVVDVEVVDEVTGEVIHESEGVVGGEAATGGSTAPSTPVPDVVRVPVKRATVLALVGELKRCGVTSTAEAEAYLPVLGSTVTTMGELAADEAISLLEFVRSLDRDKLAGLVAAAAKASGS